MPEPAFAAIATKANIVSVARTVVVARTRQVRAFGTEILYLDFAFRKRTDQASVKVSADRKPEGLRDEEIYRTARQKRRRAMQIGMHEQQPETGTQRQQEEQRHLRSRRRHP